MEESSDDDTSHDNDGDDEEDDESASGSQKDAKSSTKTPAASYRSSRLSIDSLALSDYVDDDEEEEEDEDDEDYLLSTEGSKHSKQESKKEAREYEKFKISKIIATQTLTPLAWNEICAGMNTSEITRGSRWEQEPTNKDDNEETRFLIKWGDVSFVHCSWETEEDLLDFVQGSKKALTSFGRKCDEDGKVFDAEERNDGTYFDPAWLLVDRILNIQPAENADSHLPEDQKMDQDDKNGPGRQFLVKWGNSTYSECSYEFENDLILNGIPYKEKVAEFKERCLKKSEASNKQERDKGEAEFRRLYKEVFGERSESKSQEGAVLFQQELEAREYRNGGRLRDYQAEGVSWLVSNLVNNRSCILADEMGKNVLA